MDHLYASTLNSLSLSFSLSLSVALPVARSPEPTEIYTRKTALSRRDIAPDSMISFEFSRQRREDRLGSSRGIVFESSVPVSSCNVTNKSISYRWIGV